MKRTFLILLSLLLLPALHGALRAQEDSAVTTDDRIRKQLDELELKYEVSSNGNFKLVFNLGEGRTQIVIINSATEKLENLEIREIWSPAYESTGPIPAEIANEMLEYSYSQKIGAWQVMPVSEGRMATYTAKVSGTADTQALLAAIRAVVVAADGMEQKVSTKDRF